MKIGLFFVLGFGCAFLGGGLTLADVHIVNLIHVNEQGNSLATRAIDRAIQTFNNNRTNGIHVNLKRVEGRPDDLAGFRENVCAQHSAFVDTEHQPVHAIVDTTRTHRLSLFSWALLMQSQLTVLGTSFLSAERGDDDNDVTEAILAAKVNTSCRCFPTTLMKNHQMYEVIPAPDIIPEVVRLLVAYFKMTSAAILYDQSFEIVGQYTLFFSKSQTRHAIRPLDKDGLANQVERLRKVSIYNFFVLGSLESIQYVLKNVPINYLGRNFLWTFITDQMGDLNYCPFQKNVLLITPNSILPTFPNHDTSRHSDILSETYYQLTTEYIAARAILMSLPFNKSPSTNTDCAKSQKLVSKVNEGIYSEHYSTKFKYESYAGQRLYLDFFMNVSVVRCNEYSQVGSQKTLAKWRAWYEDPLNVIEDVELQSMSAVLVYQVSTVLQEPFVMIDHTSRSGYKGYCIDLIDQLASSIGFEYNITVVADQRFGNLNPDGTWTGVVNEIIAKRADIGLGTMSVMAERENVIDFTIPFYDLVGISIMINVPRVQTDYFRFLTVMERDVWLCIMVSYFITSGLLWITDRMSPFSYQNNQKTFPVDPENRIFSLKESLWFCLMCLTPQGGGSVPRSLSARCVTATWWLYGFIIVASYTANLAAFLTVNRLESSIENLDDLANQYKIQYSPLRNSVEMSYFERMAKIETRFYNLWKEMTMNDSLQPIERTQFAVWDYPLSDKYTKLWDMIQRTGAPRSLDEAVFRVKNSTPSSGYAFLGDAVDIEYLTMLHCDLKSVGEEFSRKPYAIAVQQGSPLKTKFDKEIIDLLSSRWLEKLKIKWWPREKQRHERCAENQEGRFDGIGIENIGGFFLTMLLGIALACVALVCEYFWFRRKRSLIVSQIPLHKQHCVGPHLIGVGGIAVSAIATHDDAETMMMRMSQNRRNSRPQAEDLQSNNEQLDWAISNIIKCRKRRRQSVGFDE